MKQEALKLADELDALHQYVPSEAPVMIRRLVEELDKQTNQKPYGYLCDWGNTDYGITRQVFYYTQQGSATEDDWNESPKVHKNLPLYLAPQTKPTITKLDGKVVAVTMTDDEHSITEVLWEAPKPLSDEEIKEIIKDCIEDDYNMIANPYALARAIEERHGIK